MQRFGPKNRRANLAGSLSDTTAGPGGNQIGLSTCCSPRSPLDWNEQVKLSLIQIFELNRLPLQPVCCALPL
jgi:hypothetical protein